MPIGIFSAPDHLQKCMNEILSGLPDIAYLINDILVYGSTLAEHDKHLQAILEWIQSAGARSVNSSKPQSNSLVTLSHPKESCLIHQMHCLTHHKNIPFKRYNYWSLLKNKWWWLLPRVYYILLLLPINFPPPMIALKYQQAQTEDPVCSQLINFVCSQLINFGQTNWCSKHTLLGELNKYWTVQHNLGVCNNLLLYGTCIVTSK